MCTHKRVYITLTVFPHLQMQEHHQCYGAIADSIFILLEY